MASGVNWELREFRWKGTVLRMVRAFSASSTSEIDGAEENDRKIRGIWTGISGIEKLGFIRGSSSAAQPQR